MAGGQLSLPPPKPARAPHLPASLICSPLLLGTCSLHHLSLYLRAIGQISTVLPDKHLHRVQSVLSLGQACLDRQHAHWSTHLHTCISSSSFTRLSVTYGAPLIKIFQRLSLAARRTQTFIAASETSHPLAAGRAL